MSRFSSVDVTLTKTEHIVRFYERDEELVAPVAELLADALAKGCPVVAIMAAEHRRAVEQRLAELLPRSGGGESAPPEEPRLVALDADDTLAEILVDGRPDAARFDEVVGAAVRLAAGRGRPLVAYGEMVDRLWQAGQVVAAVRLEELWNALLEKVPFTLHCAYRSEGGAEGLVDVCGLHSSVAPGSPGEVPARSAARTFACDALAARAARGFAKETLTGLPQDVRESVLLVVSELATNAVVHAGSEFTISFAFLPHVVRVAVSDCSFVAPSEHAVASDHFSGRGLRIVSALSSRWGCLPAKDGKVVWAEVARRGADEAA